MRVWPLAIQVYTLRTTLCRDRAFQHDRKIELQNNINMFAQAGTGAPDPGGAPDPYQRSSEIRHDQNAGEPLCRDKALQFIGPRVGGAFASGAVVAAAGRSLPLFVSSRALFSLTRAKAERGRPASLRSTGSSAPV